MNALLNLIQGSPEWHTHRSQYRNASETPAVMGVSPWLTPYELWLLKTERKVVEETAPMRHGTQMESQARLAFEEATGLILQPMVVVDGQYSASLDGITLSGDTLVEIKCPFKGQTSELWQTITSGSVPEHYNIQVQHQLMVSKARLAYLWVFDGSNGILATVYPDEDMFQCIRDGWDNFTQYLDEDRPPPLTDSDVLVRIDDIWRKAAESYAKLKQQADDLATQADEARQRLIQLASHTSEQGFGVTVTRFWKAGSVSYKGIPELAGVDLELYRGKMREEVRVTIAT